MKLLPKIVKNRDNLVNGNLNCFPYKLEKFRKHIPGAVQGTYIIVTANTKVGKTQLTDFLYWLTPMEYLYNRRGKTAVDLNVEYVSLEQAKDEKLATLYSYMATQINKKNNIDKIVTISNLLSIETPISEEDLTNLTALRDLIEFCEEKITIADHLFTALDIIHYIHEVAKKYGAFDENGKWKAFNDNVYVNLVIDHVSLMGSDAINKDIFTSIGFLSKEIVKLKKVYYIFIFILIQQQTASAESIEAVKFRNGEPTLDNLGENKSTGRDADLVIGLYSPFRQKIVVHEGMDVSQYKDNYRSLMILADRHFGKIGLFSRLYFDGSYNYFRDL